MNFDVLSFLFESIEASGVIGGYVALSLVVVNELKSLDEGGVRLSGDMAGISVTSASKQYSPNDYSCS